MIIENNRVVADFDKWLTNGITVGKVVYLGVNDDISNWHEISNEEYESMFMNGGD